MEICIVRHGQTEWNVMGKLQGQADIPLNDTGLMQAQVCAHALINKDYDLIVSSPLLRAKQTADCIAQHANIEMVVMEEWTERSFGIVEGMTMEERNVKYPSFEYPEAEPFAALQARIRTALSKMLMLQAQRVIVVSHGAAINALIAMLTNGEAGTGKTGIQNGSFTFIYYENQQWQIQKYNDTDHMTK